MKMNIQIIKNETGFLKTPYEIVNIDINNGHWKYVDNLMETEEKISLTINSIRKSHYLEKPVKDAYPFYDHEHLKETNELKVTDAMVRSYETLLDFLNCRINNTKEDYKRHGWTEREFEAVLFDLKYVRATEDDVVGNMVYEADENITVKIKVVE